MELNGRQLNPLLQKFLNNFQNIQNYNFLIFLRRIKDFIPILYSLNELKIDLNDKNCISLGAGSGDIEIFLSNIFNFSNFDLSDHKSPSKSNLDIINSLHNYNFKLFDVDEANPFELQSYDMVMSTQVIEHINDYKSFFKLKSKLLKKNGIMILSTPFYDSTNKPSSLHMQREWDLHSHYHPGFDFSDIMNLSKENNLEILYSSYSSFIVGEESLYESFLKSEIIYNAKLETNFLKDILKIFYQAHQFCLIRNLNQAKDIFFVLKKIN